MKNDYNKQAEDFLTKANATIKIELAKNQLPPLWHKDGQDYGLMYNVTITRQDKNPYSFNFWDSVYNKEQQELKATLKNSFGDLWVKGKYYDRQQTNKIRASKETFTPKAYDILACLTKYDPESFENFCQSYGYDEDSRTAEHTFLAVIKEWNETIRMFGDLLEDLQEIN